MESKSFQNTIFAILFIVLALILSIFIVDIPSKQDASTVARSGIAREFNPDIFEGWVFTMDALERQEAVLYGPEPDPNSDDAEEAERAKIAEIRDYPAQYFPTLIEEYGIAVQKPYSGNYLFQAQKQKMLDFLDDELVLLSESLSLFKPTSDPVNANDAVVLKAIEKYTILLEALHSRVSNMTYADSKEKSIGTVLSEGLSEEDFSQPIAYGMLANEHLKNNIRAHQGAYYALLNEDHSMHPPNVKQVSHILGLDPNTGEPLEE